MKRISVLIFVFFILLACAYSQWLRRAFVDRSFAQYTGIDNASINLREHTDFYWFARARVTKDDETRLLHKYTFTLGFSRAILKGKYAGKSVADCPECYYFMDQRDGSAYKYLLILVNSKDGTVSVAEVFAS